MTLEQLVEEIARRVVRAELAAREPEEPALITVAQAAARIGMSLSFVRAAIADERLPARKVGRAVRVTPADVDALAAAPKRREPRSSESPAARAARVSIGCIGAKR